MRKQHGVVARRQLLELGFTRHAIEHRRATGRLHVVYAGVYSVGRPDLTQLGRWMAAVLSCGDGALLSHAAAGALWGFRASSLIEVSVAAGSFRRRPGIVVHRRSNLTKADVAVHRGIPVTSPVCALVDLAVRLPKAELERAVSEADQLKLELPSYATSWTGERSGSRARSSSASSSRSRSGWASGGRSRASG